MEGGWNRATLLIAGILMSAGVVESPCAGESSYGFGYVGEHSDNITRTSAGGRGDWEHSVLAGYAFQERTVDIAAHVQAQITYNRYQDKTFGDEVLYDLNSSAIWAVSPQRLFWRFDDDYQQGLADSVLPDTPSNRVSVNVISTGPDFYLRLTPMHTLIFGARAGDVYTGRINADNARFNGLIGWLYRVSPVLNLSLNYQVLDVRYSDPVLNSDFTSKDTFFHLQYRPSASQYSLDLGNTDIRIDRGNEINGMLARLSWMHQLTPESTIEMSVNREFSNTGTDVLAGVASVSLPVTPIGMGQASGEVAGTQASNERAGELSTVPWFSQTFLTSDVYGSKGAALAYTYRGSQVDLRFMAGRRALDFVSALLDRSETSGNLQVDYSVSRITRVGLFYSYVRTAYRDFMLDNLDRDSGIRLDYRASNSITLELEGRRAGRGSTDPAMSFVDNRVLFSILFREGEIFSPLHTR